uniref:Dscam n=1 Tax=Angiostrongylus cantonensis TaxID=6313 RepID=A0A158P9W6_ANGCA
EDVWHILDAKAERESVEAEVEFSILSSKTLHCKAKNVAGSNFTSLKFNVKKPGDPPRDVQVIAIDARDVVIAWKAPKYPNMKIKFYELLLNEDVDEDVEYWQRYRTSAREDLPLTRLTLSTEQLKPSYIYYVRVRAFNEAGSGPFSDPIHFITPNGGPENAPTGVTVDINEANIAVIRWQRPNSSTEILNYVIYFTRDLGISNEDYREWHVVEVPASQTHYTFDHQIGLKPKTFYRVRVGAKNDIADGPVSETIEFETAYSELPIPTDIKIKVNEDNSLTITFSAVRDPDDHSNVIEHYKIELAQSDDVLTAHWFPVNTKTITVDHVTSKVTIEIDGSSLATSSMYWMKITVSLDNPTRFVQASKPRWFRTGDGKLKTRVKIEGAPLVEREPNVFEELQLVCRAEGSPAPVLAWYWNDNKIQSESQGWSLREENSDRKTVSVLTRNSVCESGRAVCIATNDDSSATAEIEVRVLGPGSAPRDVNVIGWRNQINISWIEPLFPNGVIMIQAVMEALGSQGVPAQYTKILRELYKNFTTKISPFYNDINVDIKRGVRQGYTISPKLFTATLQNVMRALEWDNMGVKIDGRQLHHLRFADDIVLITPDISQAERMLADFDKACGKIGLRLDLKKTMFMKNGLVSFAPFTLNGTNISEYSSYVYLVREINMMNDLAPELSRRKRAAWGAFKSIEDVKYIVYYATRNAIDLSEWDKAETETTKIDVEATSPETIYLVRVQAATADGPGIISEPVEYEPIVLSLFTTNVVDFEAEPNQTVTIRCSAQGQPTPRLFYAWENDTEIEVKDLLVSTTTHHVSAEFLRSAFTNDSVTCRAENKHENVNITRMLIIRKPGDAPSNVTWMFDKNDSLFINWNRVRYPNGNVTYVLYLSNFVDRVSGPPIRIPKVPYNVNVTLQISAENEWGEGQKSPPITFLTPNGGPKDAPSITALQSKDSKHYTIYFKKSEESDEQPWQYVEVNANRTQFIIDSLIGLQENAQYKLKISAANERHEGPTSENYIMYIRPEYGGQYWKYEATNVTESQETIVIEHFPLDKNVSYRMKIAGVKHGKESQSSYEFPLVVYTEPALDDLPEPREPVPPQSTPLVNTAEKRRIVKEPPL